MGKMRSKEDQLPQENTDEDRILDQIRNLKPEEFELFGKSLFQELANQSGVQHQIRENKVCEGWGV